MPSDDPVRDLDPRARRGAAAPGRGASRDESGRTGSTGRDTTWSHRPAALLVAVGLILLEAVALVVVTGVSVVSLVRGDAALPGPMVFFAVFCLLVAAVLVQASRALLAGRRWARSPVITWQVLLGVMAVGWLGVEVTAAATAVLVVAVAVTAALLLPPVVAFTTGSAHASGGPGGSTPR